MKNTVEPLTAASEMLAVTLAHSFAKKSFGAVPRLARQNSLKVSVCIACVAATRIALHFLLALVCFRSEAKFMNFRFFSISSQVMSRALYRFFFVFVDTDLIFFRIGDSRRWRKNTLRRLLLVLPLAPSDSVLRALSEHFLWFLFASPTCKCTRIADITPIAFLTALRDTSASSSLHCS